MKLHLSNLDELVQRVRSPHAKNYLNEAVVSYRAGAYRASLIATWIAVCVDIIEKVKELSASGDAAAKAIEDRLKKISPSDPASMLAFEKDVLGIASDQLELISVIEKMHLERLKEDRNICAHPTFSIDGAQFTPLAETALSYIVQSSNYLLIQRPVKGKSVIDRIYELINESSFPEDEEKAYIVLSSDNNLGRVKESSVRNLTIILLKRLFRDDIGLAPDKLGRIASSLGVISRLYSHVYDEVLNSKLSPMLAEASDKLLKRLYPFLKLRTEAWEKVEEGVRVRMEGLLPTMEIDEVINYDIAGLAEINSDINMGFMAIFDKYSSSQKSRLIAASVSPLFKEYAVSLFSDASSFDSAEYRGANLILPLVDFFTLDDVRNVLEGACNNSGNYGHNQILYAGAIEAFFIQFYDGTIHRNKGSKEAWVAFVDRAKEMGVVFESLNSKLVEDGLIKGEVEKIEPDIDNIPF